MLTEYINVKWATSALMQPAIWKDNTVSYCFPLFICGGPYHLSSFKQRSRNLVFLREKFVWSVMGWKKHSRLCLYYHNNITKTLSLNFFYKNYIAHYSCHFPQHVKWAPGRVWWRGAGLFKWLNRCSQLVWTDGAGHLLWRSRARGRGESEGDRRQNTSLPLEPPHRNMSSKCPKCEKTVYFGE